MNYVTVNLQFSMCLFLYIPIKLSFESIKKMAYVIYYVLTAQFDQCLPILNYVALFFSSY